MTTRSLRTAWHSLARAMGLIYADDGRPQHGDGGQSRYGVGFATSRRLDEDIDQQRARLDALEQRLEG